MRETKATLFAAITILTLMASSCSPAKSSKPASASPQGQVGTTATSPPPSRAAAAPSPVLATLSYLEGGVAIAEGSAARQAELGDAVPAGARVSTSAASRCDLELGGLGILRILPQSVVELSALDLGAGRRLAALRLIAGSVAAKVDKLASRDRFGISAQSAVFSVRGTEFVLALSAAGTMRVAVKEGTVAILPAALNPIVLGGNALAEAIYAAALAAATGVGAGQEASFAPRDLEAPAAAWEKAALSIESLVVQGAGTADPAALMASAPMRKALSSFAAAEAPLAASARKAGPESLKEFSQFDAMPAPKGEAAAPPPRAAPQAKEGSAPAVRLETVDDFADPAFDGGVDAAKWSVEGDAAVVAPRQRDGAMRFEQDGPASADTDLYLVAKLPASLRLRDARSLEGRLSLGTDANSGFSHIAVNFRARGPSGDGDFWIEADLMNMGDRLEVLCTASNYNNGNDRTEYRKDYLGDLSLGKTYAIRIDLDPGSGNIAWFLDGREIARGNSPTLAASEDRAADVILNSFRSKGSYVTTRADSVAYARAP